MRDQSKRTHGRTDGKRTDRAKAITRERRARRADKYGQADRKARG